VHWLTSQSPSMIVYFLSLRALSISPERFYSAIIIIAEYYSVSLKSKGTFVALNISPERCYSAIKIIAF